jgi:hypothetical protein
MLLVDACAYDLLYQTFLLSIAMRCVLLYSNAFHCCYKQKLGTLQLRWIARCSHPTLVWVSIASDDEVFDE